MQRIMEYNHAGEWTADNCYHMSFEVWCDYMSRADNWDAWVHGL